MSHNFTGVEIGSGTLKLVSVRGGTVRRSAFAPLPDHLVAQGSIAVPELLGDRLRELRRGLRGAPKPAALVLPAEAVISRVVTLPAMSARQLDLNLPYEFKDYISREAGRYRYDYAVQRLLPGENGGPGELELFASAVPVKTIDLYAAVLQRAGLALTVAIPPEMAFADLIHARADLPAELAVVDIGYASTWVYIYRDGFYRAGKEIEIGSHNVDEAIAFSLGLDNHLASTYKEANQNNALMLDSCLSVYGNLAVEVMKTINYYGYEYRDNDLRQMVLCGGGARIAPLREALQKNTGLQVLGAAQLLPPGSETADADLILAAVGAALQQSGKGGHADGGHKKERHRRQDDDESHGAPAPVPAAGDAAAAGGADRADADSAEVRLS